MFLLGKLGRRGGKAPAGGGIASPSLGLDFMSGVLDPRLSVQRNANGATYVDANGIVQTAPANIARFEWDPVTHVMRGLLVEETRTNLFLYSFDLSNVGAWGASNASLVAATAPDGSNTAQGLVSNVGVQGYVVQSVAGTAGTAITLSVFVKAGTQSACTIICQGSWWADTNPRTATYTLSGSGTVSGVSAGATGAIVQMSNGWYRCVLTVTPDTTASNGIQIIRPIVNGDGTAQIYGWGAQAEVGSFQTSLIQTLGITNARPLDIVSMGSGAWLNSAQGTLAADFVFQRAAAGAGISPVLAEIDDGGTNNAIALRLANPALVQISSFVGGPAQGSATTANSWTANVVAKSAGTYTTTAATCCLNAGVVASAALTGLVSAPTRLIIGTGRSNAVNGYIRRALYWPVVLTNTQLQTITT